MRCQRCQRPVRQSWGFAIKSGDAPTNPSLHCLRCALQHRGMLRRSLMVSLVVGTLLTLLNQGDTLLAGRWNTDLYWKIPLTYCVPFLVATYGALTSSRQ